MRLGWRSPPKPWFCPRPPPKKNKRGLGATSAGDVNRGDLPLRFASVEKLAAFPRVSL